MHQHLCLTLHPLTITLYGVRPVTDADQSIRVHFNAFVPGIAGMEGVEAQLATHHLCIALSEAVVTDGNPLLGCAVVDV